MQVLLRGSGTDAALDGTVIAADLRHGERIAIVRFGGLDWDTREQLLALAHRRAPGPAAGATWRDQVSYNDGRP